MTEKDLHTLLHKLDEQSFAVLSSAQLDRLGNDLKKHLELIERETVATEIAAFEATVPLRAKKLFQAACKARNLSKPPKNAPPAKIRAYVASLKDVWQDTQARVRELEAELSRLKETDEDRAVQHIKGLSVERRKLLSQLAGLSRMAERGSAAINLSASEKNNRLWLAELRKKLPGRLLSQKS